MHWRTSTANGEEPQPLRPSFGKLLTRRHRDRAFVDAEQAKHGLDVLQFWTRPLKGRDHQEMAREGAIVDLQIDPVWRPSRSCRDDRSPHIDPERAFDEVATCTLRLVVNNRLLTRIVDEQQRPHDGPRVSAFRLAEWFLWNWWRIRWEPSRSRGDSLSWRQAHETASIGGGWLWPRLRFDSDGQTVTIRFAGSEATVTEPVSYVGDEDEQFVSAQNFEQAVDLFLQQVLTHLSGNQLSPNSVARMWDELRDEREDPKLTTYRRFEALLGHNPGEADHQVIDQLTKDRAVLGDQATNEIAADAPLTTGVAMTADNLLGVARQSGFDIRNDLGSSPMTDNSMTLMETDQPGPLVPWQIGRSAAKALRRSERLGERPITDRLLCEMCGLPSGALTRSSRIKPPMAYTLSTKRGPRIVFRARVPTGRRFDAARLLGDKLMVRNGEPLKPATNTHTFRQKMQRAFAAELLCPFDALVARLDGDHSDESIEEAAGKFRVSPMLVAACLENNGMLDSRGTRFAPA